MNNSVDDNRELFDAYRKSGSVEDRNRIVEKYLYIVNILVRKYLNRGVDYDDLYQVGSMALVLAAQRYDPERGVDFPAFAAPTILGEIKRYFRDKGWAIKVPRKMKDLSIKIPSVKEALEAELGRAPKIQEIAERLSVTEEDVLQAMESGKAYSAYSLQQSMDEDESDGGETFLARYTGEEDSAFQTMENADFLRRVMEKFTPEERKFCDMRFVQNKTQQQIAGELGVSQMTVSRIEKKIKQKFKEEYQR